MTQTRTDGLEITKPTRFNEWFVVHADSGLKLTEPYKPWPKRWLAEEFADRISDLANWTLPKEAFRNRKDLQNQVKTIFWELRKEMKKKTNRWPYTGYKTKEEFYRKENK